jgi:hypothetical protein
MNWPLIRTVNQSSLLHNIKPRQSKKPDLLPNSDINDRISNRLLVCRNRTVCEPFNANARPQGLAGA